MSFQCHRLDQNTNNFFLRIAALASKNTLNQKRIKALYLFLLFKIYLIRDFFWFDLFLEARAEILKKILGILVQMMTLKGHFEINWPLETVKSTVEISKKFCGLLRIYEL